jgi:anti-sigma factor RsiW
MAQDRDHVRDALQELLDGRLPSGTRREVDAHLEECGRCRGEWQALIWTKQLVAGLRETTPTPDAMEAELLAALDAEDRAAQGRARGSPWWRRRLALLGYAAAASIALVSVFHYLHRPGTLPAQVVRDHAAYRAGSLSLQLQTHDIRLMERFFVEHGVPFPTRVFDLGMMGYRLEGGRVHRLGGRLSALFVYRGEGGKILVCEMYPGYAGELPGGAELRESKGIRFYVYRTGRTTTVFWQEGDVVCALSSDADTEEVIGLAFAKAVAI